MTQSSAYPAPAGFRLEVADGLGEELRAPVRVVHPDAPLSFTLVPTSSVRRGWYELEVRFGPEGTVDCLAEFVHANGRIFWLRLPMLARNEFLAHLRIEDSLERLTLVVGGSGRIAELRVYRFARVGWSKQFAAVWGRARDIYRRRGVEVLFSALSYLSRIVRRDTIAIPRGSAKADGHETPYEAWIRVFDERPERDRARHSERMATLAKQPSFSVLAELTAADPLALDRLAQSMREQIYPCWELVVAAPASVHETIKTELDGRGVDVAKVKVSDARPNTPENLNRLLAISTGEYVLPLATRALMRPHALLEFALTADRLPSAEMIYCDEDHIRDDGSRDEWEFKPAWSPHLLQSRDYLGPHIAMPRETVRALDGWNVSRSEPYQDLALRLAARVKPETIVHVAKVLFHRPLGDSFGAHTQPAPRPASTHQASPVSLIIPTRDNADMLSACIESIRKRTRYRNYEILIVDNGSVERRTKDLLNKLGTDPTIRVLAQPDPFNFSALNNAAVRMSSGDMLGFVNDDIEVLNEDWLEQMVCLADEGSVGCVGAKLVYPDRRIQHGGIVLGLYGIAGHAHRFANNDDPGYLNRLTTVQEVSAVTAACLLVRRKVFDQVGGLDEGLAVAFNDVDFCLRVRAAGYLNVWTPYAELIHHESVSRGRDLRPAKSRRFAEEHVTMQQRWGRELLNDPYYSPHLTYDHEDFSLRQR